VVNLNKKIILKTKHLNIRKFTIRDTEQIYNLSIEEGIKRWLPDQVYKSKAEAKATLQFLISQYDSVLEPDKNPYILGLELKENKELIGHVGLSPFQEEVEIGYAVGNKYQGFGYATEAVSSFSKWVLNKLNLDFIWGIVNKDNKASIKVLEKANYKYIDKENNKFRYKFLRKNDLKSKVK